MNPSTIPQSKIARFFFSDLKTAWFWLILRVYVGYEWLAAGLDKVVDPVNGPKWVGAEAGTAVKGFLTGALGKADPVKFAHPDVSQGYAYFINNFAMPNAELFSYMVAYGEVLVGAALILGFLTGLSAFFGVFMNFNYLFAGTVSVNPEFLLLGLLLILSWRVSGWFGLDRYVLPKIFRNGMGR